MADRSGGNRPLKTRVKATRGRTESSRRWLERQLNDPYVARARRAGYRARSAYKLIEIDDRHKLLKPGQAVVDLGAAPGGWSQVAAARVEAAGRGCVVAIDLLPIDPIAGVTVLELDFLEEDAPDRIAAALPDGRADVVLSDLAAPTTGHRRTDHLKTVHLTELAADFARRTLKPGGVLLAKVFRGGTEATLLAELKRDFASVRHVKPPASRAESVELYLLATGFRGRSD